MSGTAPDLGHLQSWLQAVVTDPAGPGAVDAEEIEAFIAGSPSLPARERLAIHCRSYHERLRECLRAEFPGLAHALGAELFDHFSFEYLQRHPPRAYTLNRLGERFPQYLAESRPDADLPEAERESWPDFIIDLAILERSFSECYHGPGVEGRALLGADRLRALSTASLSALRLVPVVGARLLALRYPVGAYLVAARRGEPLELPGPKPSFLLVHRLDYTVRFVDLSAAQYAFLDALFEGRRLGEAVQRVREPRDAEAPIFAADAKVWLCEWADLGLFDHAEH